MINPFVTTGYAGAEYFCDRVQETKDISAWLQNGNNIALISPRRYGKTDLIRHCFEQPEIKDNCYTFIIDIYSTKSLSEMVNKMGRTILEMLKPKGSTLRVSRNLLPATAPHHVIASSITRNGEPFPLPSLTQDRS